MSPGDRQQRIVELISAQGRVEVADLAVVLDVSPMTIRRDLASLAADGAILRVHRGAARQPSASYEPPYGVRANLSVEAKRRIGVAVSGMLEDGQTVVIDGGSTGVAVAECLVERTLTVCTPSMRVANVLLNSASVRVMLTGGFIRPGEHSLVGSAAIATVSGYHFDVFVMTASGVHLQNGITEWNPEDAEVKRAALKASERCLLACDATKLGRTAFARVAYCNDVDVIVTDMQPADRQREMFADMGVGVEVA